MQHKAETAYRRATAVDPAQTLAWQGLSGLYEKAKPGELDDRDSKLLSVYQKLVLAHAADPKKVEELRAKIGPLLVELERTADAYEFYAAELVTAADGSEERKYDDLFVAMSSDKGYERMGSGRIMRSKGFTDQWRQTVGF